MSVMKDRIQAQASAPYTVIRGNTVPRQAGIIEEQHTVVVENSVLSTKRACTYQLTMQQFLFIKTHGGSEFMRALLEWFAKAEASAVKASRRLKTKEQQATPFTYFEFGGVPVIVDENSTPLWRTFLWAKAHNVKDPEAVARSFFDFRDIDDPDRKVLRDCQMPF